MVGEGDSERDEMSREVRLEMNVRSSSVFFFFFKVYQHNGYIRGGAGIRPENFIKPDARPDPTGFCDFQPEPANKGLKSARIRAGRLRLVGSGGFCPPLTPIHKSRPPINLIVQTIQAIGSRDVNEPNLSEFLLFGLGLFKFYSSSSRA
jgi:hypothetical protein